jgi:hypothetical protein
LVTVARRNNYLRPNLDAASSRCSRESAGHSTRTAGHSTGSSPVQEHTPQQRTLSRPQPTCVAWSARTVPGRRIRAPHASNVLMGQDLQGGLVWRDNAGISCNKGVSLRLGLDPAARRILGADQNSKNMK